MRTIRIISALAVVSLGLLFLGNDSLLAQTTPPPEPVPVNTTLDDLRDKADREGSVRVIVGLSAGGTFKPESELGGASAVDAQRASITQAQDTLLKSAAIDNADVAARYKYVPYMALRLNRKALDRLIASGRATTIMEDIPVPPALESTIPIIGADRMYDLGSDGTGWTVAILDTGIDEDHPYFADHPTGSRIVDEACFSNAGGLGGATSLCPNGSAVQTTGLGSADAETDECIYLGTNLCSHGTHVAGIAAGNETGATGAPGNGVAPDADIVAVQVFTRFPASACGGTTPCVMSYVSDQLSGLEYIYDQSSTRDFSSINVSIGGGYFTGYCDTHPAKSIIDTLLGADIVTVIAAGNNTYSDGINSPGCISSAFTVGATDDGDGVALFSNRGPMLDVFAPGVNITSSVPVLGPDAAWGGKNGTSMAAPMVTGGLAVMREADPSASVDDILEALKNTGAPVSYASGGETRATPRINLLGAHDTLSGGNSGPNTPRSPSPASGAIEIGSSVTLFWVGGDPDLDTVTYDVFLENDPAPNILVCDNVTTPSCSVDGLIAGTFYRWRVEATSGSTVNGPVWNFMASNTLAVSNDDISAALEISGATYSNTQAAWGATSAPDDPITCSGTTGNDSVWYRYTPPSNGLLNLDTIGSTYDTVLAVWVGSRGSLIGYACDDDISYPSNVQSEMIGVPVTAGTTYLIEVVGWDSSQYGTMKLNSKFTPSANTKPNVPSLMTPSLYEAQVALTPEFEWLGGDPDFGDGVTYKVYVGTSSKPSTQVCNVTNDITSCTSSIALNDNTLYYWKIVATDTHNASVTSPVWSFLAGAPPAPPNDNIGDATPITNQAFSDIRPISGATTELTDPPLSCSGNHPRYQSVWYTLHTAHSGTLNVNTTGSTSSGKLKLDTIIAVWTGTPGALSEVGCNEDEQLGLYTSRLDIPVTAGETYYIEVANFINSIANLKFSATYTPVNAAPDVPSGLSPANLATDIETNPTFSWTGSDPDGDPLTYDVYVGTSSKAMELLCNDTSATTCALEPEHHFAFGSKVYWKVVATDSVFASTTSPVWSFTTAAAPPALSSPKNSSASSKQLPKFGWKAVKGASAYHIQISEDPDDWSAPVFQKSDVPKNSYVYLATNTPPQLDYGTYYWRVAAFVGGAWTDWSTPFSFDITVNKTPKKNSLVTKHATAFSWGAIPNATDYDLEVFLGNGTCTGAALIETSSGSTKVLSSDVGPDLEFGQYSWHVRSSAGAITDFGPCWPFTVTSLKSPKNGSAVTSLLPKFSWGANKLAAGYNLTVQLVPPSGPLPAAFDKTDLTSPSYKSVLGDFTEYGRYAWHIQENGGYALATPDFEFYITVMSKPANNSFTLDNTPAFSWKKVKNAVDYTLEITTWDDTDFSDPVRTYTEIAASKFTVPVTDGLPRGRYLWRIVATGVDYVMPAWSFTVGP